MAPQTITLFANGFAKGALDACGKLSKTCVAYHKYISDFVAPARGARVAGELAELGADVVFEAGGTTGTCALVTASRLANVRAVIGVDVDRATLANSCLGVSFNASKVITSALKRVDRPCFGVQKPCGGASSSKKSTTYRSPF